MNSGLATVDTEFVEIEKSVLGAVLLEPKILTELSLRPEQFGVAQHRELYKKFLEMEEAGAPIELTALADYIGFDRLDTVGGLAYLAQLGGITPTTVNTQYYADRVISYHQQRETVRIGLLMASGELNLDDGMRKLQEIRESVASKHNGDIGEPLKKVVENVGKARGGLTGVTTGSRDLNKITNGFQRTDLILVAARPSVGKSAFLNNVILAAMKSMLNPKGGNALVFSAEMSAEQLLARMASTIGNIDSQKIRTGTMDLEDWKKFNYAIDILWKARNGGSLRIIDTPSIYLSEIWRQARDFRREYPDDDFIIGIDYLQLVRADGKFPSKREEVEEISRSLKSLAREVNAPVVALSQLTRGPEQRQDKRPMMSDLRDSGGLEQDADVVAFLYRDDYYDKETENRNLVEIIVAKQRNGPTGTVQMAYLKEYSKFVNIDYGVRGSDEDADRKEIY